MRYGMKTVKMGDILWSDFSGFLASYCNIGVGEPNEEENVSNKVV